MLPPGFGTAAMVYSNLSTALNERGTQQEAVHQVAAGRLDGLLPDGKRGRAGKISPMSLSGIRKHKLGLAVGDTLSSAKIGSGKPGAPPFCLRTHARPFFAAYAGLFPLGSLRHLQGSP